MANRSFSPADGFSLVEVLVTLVIVMIGLLGLAGVQMRAHQAEMESYQRAQALILLSDMADRLNANRRDHRCYAFTTDNVNPLGTGYVGTPACVTSIGTVLTKQRADADLADWNLLLQGAAETVGGNRVGAMIGARGCITEAAPNTYRVSVAWQGLARTVAPDDVAALGPAAAAATCGKDLYGNDALRREISTTVRFATLS